MKIKTLFLLTVIFTGSCRPSNPSIQKYEDDEVTDISNKELIDRTSKTILVSMEAFPLLGLIRDCRIIYANRQMRLIALEKLI